MSLPQSRSDKSDSHYRNFGRTASSGAQQQRILSQKGGGSASRGGAAPPPSSSLPSNCSFKKPNNPKGAQQSRTNTPHVNSDPPYVSAPQHTVQNGSFLQPPVHGSDVPIAGVVKQSLSSSTQKINRAVPKSPASQSPALSSGVTPAKSPGDAPIGYSLQFGSISPGFMNGMQIPARTSSAPPNLDEQKRDQGRHESFRQGSIFPAVSAPKQKLPQKDPSMTDHSKSVEVHPTPKAKRETQVMPAPNLPQIQKPTVVPMGAISVPIPFHVQFGAPKPQIQSQGLSSAPIQMQPPIQLSLGNTSQVQQQMFVSNLQHHPMQHQGIIHQGQNLGFTAQIGPPIAPRQANFGMVINQQFQSHLAGNFVGARRPVKITDPKTREDVPLDNRMETCSEGGSAGQKTQFSVPQSQHSFPSGHPINYYAPTYNANPHYFSAQGSIPLPSPVTPNSRPVRFNYSVNQGPHPKSFVNPSLHNSYSSNKTSSSIPGISEPANMDRGCDFNNSTPPSSLVSVPVSIKPAPGSLGEKVSDSPLPISCGFGKGDSAKLTKPIGEGSPKLGVEVSMLTSTPLVKESVASSVASIGCQKVEPFSKSGSTDDNQMKPGEGRFQPELQATGQSVIPENVNAIIASVSTTTSGPVLESTSEALSSSCSTTCEASESNTSTVGEGSTSEPVKLIGSGHIVTLDEGHGDEKDQFQLQGGGHKNKNGESEEEWFKVKDGPREGTCDTENVIRNSHGDTITVTEKAHEQNIESDYLLMSNFLDSNSVASPKEFSVVKSDKELTPDLSQLTMKSGIEGVENTGTGQVSNAESVAKDKPAVELSWTKSTMHSSKKKRKELFLRADAAGTTSDLYMAYKSPDEKKDVTILSESMSVNNDPKHVPAVAIVKDVVREQVAQSKVEPEDWEDAADISTPTLETLDNGDLGQTDNLTKKYSRDFLLKFADHCSDIPEGLEITPDMETLISKSHDSHPSPGRIVDRSSGASRQDRRGSVVEDEKWSKIPGHSAPGRDLQLDGGYGGNVIGFRPGQGSNFGALRSNLRSQGPAQYVGGILSGPMQSTGSHGGLQRNSPDAERWQRATGFQKGLIHSHTPLQVMHRAEKKYEIGKVSDEEEAKQRQLKAILNKLTPQNFEKLFEQVKAVNIDNAVTLTGVISQIFDKALMEPTFCEMYANFCQRLAGELPDLIEDNEKITFKRMLLNKCQEEFERGEMEQEDANRVEAGEMKQSKEEREDKRVQARKRMLGNIRLIGELYKKKMLTEKIMHSCINKLLGQNEDADEEDIESLCKLMSTIGESIDHPKAKEHMDAYFDIMGNLSNNMKLSSRVRFMLKDAVDLRRNKWQQRRKVEGPKKIDEVHRDAAQERNAQSSRLQRGPSMSSSMRRGAMDFGPRVPAMISSSNTPIGSFRGYPSQARGYGNQDVRSDERPSYEARHLSVPLPQRLDGDDSITLGPQGGLARGMSNRGPHAMPSVSLPEMPPSPGDYRRIPGSVNCYNASTEKTPFVLKEFPLPRHIVDGFVGPSDQSSGQEHSMPYGNRDLKISGHDFDGPLAASPAMRVQEPAFTQNNVSETSLPEERLHEKSITAIKEYYSAKDETEVALCIKELKSPAFHSTMISLWVTDSFERKDMERDLLANLLVNLIKSHDGLLTPPHLLKGFELVLTTLEDAVNDAPKAVEFLARIFAKSILEDVVTIEAIGDLVYNGGEVPGSLLEVGLAADLLGSILEMIQSEKGDNALNEIRSTSNLQWENFRPPGSMKSRKLENFI